MTDHDQRTPTDTRPAWRAALARLPQNRRFAEVRSFGGYCVRRRITPTAITEATVAAYEDHLRARRCADAGKRARSLRHQLNAATASAAWPGPSVAAPTPADRTRLHRPRSAFERSFQRALDQLERELSAPTETPPDRAHSVVNRSTARKIVQRVRESASQMIDMGMLQPSALTSPCQLLAPDRLTALFTNLETRVAPTHVRNYAKALIPVCRVFLPRGSEPERLVASIMRTQPVECETIDGTPTQTLLTLLDSAAHDRLVAFPDRAFAQADAAPAALATRAWSKAGTAVILALSAPLTPGEIAGLRVGDVAPDGRPTRIKAPGDAPARAYPLPPTAAAYLTRHLDHLKRRDPQAPLMPGNEGASTTAQSLAGLVERYVQPAIGLPVTLRVLYLRHLALLLRDDPGNIDRVLAWARLTGAAHSRERLRLLAQIWQPAG